VEDYSEGENGTTGSEKSHHRLMYYPPPEDIVSNQFTVNAMDVEELRRFVAFDSFNRFRRDVNKIKRHASFRFFERTGHKGGRKDLKTRKMVGRAN